MRKMKWWLSSITRSQLCAPDSRDALQPLVPKA